MFTTLLPYLYAAALFIGYRVDGMVGAGIGLVIACGIEIVIFLCRDGR